MEHISNHQYGLFLGRMQPIHDGHLTIIKEGLKRCETLIIAIGSAQEERTARNPLTYLERALLIRHVLDAEGIDPDRYLIVGVPDREHPSDDESWGEYLLNYIEDVVGGRPSIMFEGAEEVRSHWFAPEDDIDRYTLGREMKPVSATKIRQALANGDVRYFYANTPKGIWFAIEFLTDIFRRTSR